MSFSIRDAFQTAVTRFRDPKRYVASTEETAKGPQRGGRVSLCRSFFFGVRRLEMSLWQDKPENVVYSRTKLPANETELTACADRIRYWVATGTMSSR